MYTERREKMRLEIKNLTTDTFKNINLDLCGPGLYGIIGRNGVGKSTFFTAINGEISFQGEVVVSDSLFKGRIVYLPGFEVFDENLTGMDYIKLLRGQERKKAEEYLLLFKANHFFDTPIRKYSLGMKEILAFIYSVSLNGDVIIIDELLNGLDNKMREEAFKILQNLSKEKIILLTSHILEEIEKWCNQVYFLTKGGFSKVSNFEEAKRMVLESEAF
ncbi:MAG: AAA family ATPase [Streptococcaceae bacterium]|jgi:ABC-2 type transport system ATP-binding protein|nr:AAA family ATPase [Streptococcaceae bacterium]